MTRALKYAIPLSLLLWAGIFTALHAQTATRPVVISWTASPSTGITGYNVYRAAATTGPFTLLTTTPVTGVTYTDTGTIGATYTYQVTAVAPACTATTPVTQGCGESAPAAASATVPLRPNVSATITVVVP